MAPEQRHEPGRKDDYRAARSAAALALVALMMVLLIGDLVSSTYEVNLPTLVTLATTVLGLLGLEVRDVLRRD